MMGFKTHYSFLPRLFPWRPLRLCARYNFSVISFSDPSFPNASIGNPGETLTGPPIKTFGGDDSGVGKIRDGDLWLVQYQVFGG